MWIYFMYSFGILKQMTQPLRVPLRVHNADRTAGSLHTCASLVLLGWVLCMELTSVNEPEDRPLVPSASQMW